MSAGMYIAGKWNDKDIIRKHMDEAEKLGWSITHDWTKYEADPNNPKADMAQKDVAGVLLADVVVFLFTDPGYAYRGSFTELGVALSQSPKKKIYVVCPQEDSLCRTNVFFHHASIVHVKSWEEVIRRLEKQNKAC